MEIIILLAFCGTVAMVLKQGFRRNSASHQCGTGNNAHGRCCPGRRLRFIPIVLVCLIGSLITARAVKRHLDIRRDFQQNGSALSDKEAERLLAAIRADDADSFSPIPVNVSDDSVEGLSPEDQKLITLPPIDPQPRNVTVFEPGAPDGEQLASLPEWATAKDDADGLLAVVESKPNVTVDAAEAEAVARLSERLAKEFSERHPEAAGWTPPVEFLKQSGAIGRKAIQESELTIGQFTEPVFQAFLEIAPPDDFDARLQSAWRADTVQSRLLMVGGAMGLLTLMFGSLAGYFRIDEATRGKYRRQLRAGTGALWLAAAGSAMMIMESIIG